MKRILCLLLVLLAVTAAASAAFTDEASIREEYLASVNAMSEKGIIGGFEDGSFRPRDTLTRAQAAKILCTMLAGADIPDGTTDFSDVPAGHWAEKYVAYCAKKSIVSGVGGGKFNPNGKLTGCAFAKMLLVAYGHDAEAETLTGDNWVMGTQKAMRESGMNLGVTVENEPIQRQAACRMANNFLVAEEIEKTDPALYPDPSVSFRDGKNVKLLGRSETMAEGVRLNWPGDAAEFTLECKGDLTLNYNSDEAAYYTCFVDGVECANRIKTAADQHNALLYRFILPGKHTIRIVRDSEVGKRGTSTVLTGVSVSCKASTMAATAKKELLIEAVGASWEAACGSLGTNKDSWSSSFHAGSKSYVCVAADLLNADYSIVAKGGIGAVTQSLGKVSGELYGYLQAYRDDTPYTFSRKADVIICNVGGNDKETTDGDLAFKEAWLALVKQIREKNGSDAKIVFPMRISGGKHKPGIQKLVEELGGEAANYYICRWDPGTNGVPASSGGTGHPSAADHAVLGKTMADFIRSILK